MKQMRHRIAAAMLAVSLFLFAGVASAHVTVLPKETKQGSYEVFTVRVPSEKKDVTTKSVKVRIAEGVEFKRIEPKAGWTYELEKADGDIVKSVTWTADGEGLTAVEFGEFRMQGKVAADAKELVWKAYQTYSDGSIVEWIGAPNTGSQYPASLTVVTAGAGESDGHDHGGAAADAGGHDDKDSAGEPAAEAPDAADKADTADTAETPADDAADAPDQQLAAGDADKENDTMKTVTLAVSIAALVIALAALILAIAKRRKA